MSGAKVSLTAQAAVIRLLLDRGVIFAMRRTLRESEGELVRDRLNAAADTLELFASHEAEIRELILTARAVP